MPVLNIAQARDVLFKLVNDAWQANAGALNNNVVPYIEWPNMLQDKGQLSRGNAPFARVMMRHAQGQQSTLGPAGGNFFRYSGLLTVQVFAPAGKNGLATVDALGKVVMDALENHESEADLVRIRNVTYAEIGIDLNFYQSNITAYFEYEITK